MFPRPFHNGAPARTASEALSREFSWHLYGYPMLHQEWSAAEFAEVELSLPWGAATSPLWRPHQGPLGRIHYKMKVHSCGKPEVKPWCGSSVPPRHGGSI